MAIDNETTEYNLRLNAAQMLKAIAEVNTKASSIPEALANINTALDAFATKYGISLGAAQKEMMNTISDAKELRRMLENPITAPSVLLNPNAKNLANTPDPFQSMGMSTSAGEKALNDQRKEGNKLTQQEVKSQAEVAKELNKGAEEEKRKAAALRNVVELEKEEKRLLAESAAIRVADKAKRDAQILARDQAPPAPVSKDMDVDREAEAAQIRLNQAVQKATKSGALPAQEEYNKAVNDGVEAQNKLADKVTRAGEAGEKGATRSALATRIWSVAVGMLIHQGINMLINALQSMIRVGLEGLKKLEVATYNLSNAERSLSQAGVEITFKELEGVVDRVHTKFKGLFSTVDVKDMVADIAIATKELGLNAEQIEKIAASSAALQLRNPGKTVQEVNQQLLTAILSGQTKGIRSLGVAASETAIQQEALAMGLIKTGETANAQQKSLATLSLVYKATSGDAKELARYLNSFAGKSQQLKATWQDFLSKAAEAFGPGIKIVLDYLIDGLQKAMVWLEQNRDVVSLFGEVLGEVVVLLLKIVGLVVKFGTAFGFAIRGAIDGLQKLIDKYALLKKLLGVKEDDVSETPTAPRGGAGAGYGERYGEAVKEAEEKVTEIMKDAHQKQEDMARDHANKLVDIARDYSRKLADIARSTRDKTSDAQKDYGDKVADINSDIDKKIAETKQESYKKAVDAEKKYQDELKNLREKYLMDLEEALHARDARAILKLMQQYQLDKNKAMENRDEERQQAKTEAAQKLKDLEKERKEKLAAAQKDLADKLKQIQIAAARERRDASIAHQRALADARLAYQRQLAEQRLFLQRKLADLAASIAAEYGLTAAGQAAIRALIGSAATGTGTGSNTMPAYGTTNTVAASQTGSTANAGSPSSINAGTYRPPGLAEGGTFLATRPATISIGENRPEIITATPLGKPGKDISKVFSNASGGGMGEGKIEIGMTLSPDLEARIISQTLSETANVVLRINRSKQ